MERALSLLEPYTQEPWVRGAYLVGSASRPFRDVVSDYDIEIAADDDTYHTLPDTEKHIFAMDPDNPRRVDYELYIRPWSELEGLPASTRDIHHYPFQHATVLYDPSGELAPLLGRIAELPDAVRDVRCRVHYLELLAGVRRGAKCLDRGDPLNTRLVAADAVAALAKLLFLVNRSWPSMHHWVAHELRLLGVDDKLLTRMVSALEEPTADVLSGLLDTAQRLLDEQGFDFHRDMPAFRVWAFLSHEGKRAFATWGAR